MQLNNEEWARSTTDKAIVFELVDHAVGMHNESEQPILILDVEHPATGLAMRKVIRIPRAVVANLALEFRALWNALGHGVSDEGATDDDH